EEVEESVRRVLDHLHQLAVRVRNDRRENEKHCSIAVEPLSQEIEPDHHVGIIKRDRIYDKDRWRFPELVQLISDLNLRALVEFLIDLLPSDALPFRIDVVVQTGLYYLEEVSH